MLFGKYVNRFYLKYFWNFFFGVLFLVVIDITQSFIPELLASLSKHDEQGTLTQTIVNQIGLQLLIIAIVMLIGRFIWRICILNGAHKIAADLREDMFVKSTKLSQNFYSKNKVGSIMSYYTNDLDTIHEAYGWGTVMLVDSIFLSALSFIKMMKVDISLSLICLIPLAILVSFAYIIDNKMEKTYEKRQKAFESMSDYAQELFTGIRVIKAFTREKSSAKKFAKVNENNKQKDLSLVKFNAFLDAAFTILIEAMMVIGMSIGAYFIYNSYLGKEGFSFSRDQLVEFIGHLNIIIWPMIALGQIIALRARAKTSLKRISKLLDEEIDVKDGSKVTLVDKIEGNITFKDFTYYYKNNNNPALKNITLEIKQGENVGIVGKVGSGKTSLVSILLRLDNFTLNKVFIDGIDIMNLPLKQVRDNVSFVPQDNFLFSTTIEDNVSFSDKNLSQEEIIEACEFADVHSNISDFINGYKTLVGERGVTLSGGQKQRISIARAYIKKAPIMILDDSVSAVDIKTEEKIINNIKLKRKGKTTIIVASRVSTVMHLDKIIVMNNGEIEAIGSHEELLEKSPTYSRMVFLQELEKEVEGGDFNE